MTTPTIPVRLAVDTLAPHQSTAMNAAEFGDAELAGPVWTVTVIKRVEPAGRHRPALAAGLTGGTP